MRKSVWAHMCCAPEGRAGAPQLRERPAALWRRLRKRASLHGARRLTSASRLAAPDPDSPPAERYLPKQGSHVLRRDPRINSIHPDAHVKSTPILGPLSLPAHIIAPPPSPFEFSGIKSRLPPRDLSMSTILLTTTILSKSKRSLLFWKIIRMVLVFSYCFQHDISCCRKTKKQKKPILFIYLVTVPWASNIQYLPTNLPGARTELWGKCKLLPSLTMEANIWLLMNICSVRAN